MRPAASPVGAGTERVVVVGAGPGVGAAVARRFAAHGYAVGLIARSADRLAALAADLRRATGVHVAVAAADATDQARLRSALESVAAQLGSPTSLCFSPLPDTGLIKPVLETRPEDLMASLELNIAGAATAVTTLAPAMVQRGHGSLLFTTGSAALRPDSGRAASTVTTTAATAYISLLRDTLRNTGVRVGHTIVVGPVGNDEGSHHPDAVAADLWRHHTGEATAFPSDLRLGEVGRPCSLA